MLTRNIRKPGDVGNLNFCTFTQNCNGLIGLCFKNPAYAYCQPLQGIMKKTTIHIILFVILPILFGGLIYILTRPDRLLMFDWFNKIGIGDNIAVLRYENDLKNYLQNWIIYNSPAWIWTFSLTVLLGIIWNYRVDKESILILLIPIILGVVYEISQKTGISNGTFDSVDMIFYIIGGLSGIVLIRLLNNKHKINLV